MSSIENVDLPSEIEVESGSGDSYCTLSDDSNLEDFVPEVKMAEAKFYNLHRFNGKNYQLWKRQMEIFLVENKLKPYVDGTIKRPATATEAWDLKDAEAQAFLMRGLELDQLRFLTDCTTAADMWGRLRTIHAEKSDQSVQVLLSQFINAKMDTADTVADHIAKIVSLAQRLKDMNMAQGEPVVIAKILSSLPEKYDNVRTAWYAVPVENQKLEKLTDHLINEEALQKSRSNGVDVKSDEVYLARGKRNDSGHYTSRGNSRNDNAKRGVCHFCKKPGHWARDCFKKRAYLNKNITKNVSLLTENVSGGDENAELFNVEISHNFDENDMWFADSAATEHMCMKKESFKNLRMFENDTHMVKVGDGNLLVAMGVGNIGVRIKNKDGSYCKYTISNVWYVPGIKKNLLSIGRASERGIKVVFETGGKRVSFYKNNKLVVVGFRENDKLYKLNLLPDNKIVDVNVATSTSLMEWHERLGHVNFQTLRQMISGSCVDDLNISNLDNVNPFCEGCVRGKQHRNAFPKEGATRAKAPGELIHADLNGKMSINSIGGAYYFLLLKDDYSKYCWVYFLKRKTEVLNALQRFYVDVQIKIKKLRTDGGLEFCNNEVEKFLISKRIKHEYTTPRAPEQNGYIERQNRTVVESAKSMLYTRQLPLYLWAEATATAVYVKNRTATNTLNGKTPYEKWFGRKPSVKHLRIFGSICYVHVTKDQRSKWESNSVKMMMIGYSSERKAYRVFDPVSQKCYIRRDVIFHESPATLNDSTDILIVKNNTETTDNIESESHKRTFCRNPRDPIPREPYLLRTRSKPMPGINDVANLEVAEALISAYEPVTLQEAVEADDSTEWVRAINEELDSLEENQTWILVDRPKDKNVISNRWIFKKKYTADGKIDKYKARLVVRGFSQKEGVDFYEVFSPVVKYSTVRVILSIVAANDLEMTQFDIKTAFLHGNLDETVYMEQPFGFEIGDKVCLLKKSLYGLKQASRQWNKRINEFFISYGMTQSKQDPCLYYIKTTTLQLYVVLYVDDGLICGNDVTKMNDLVKRMSVEFKIKSSDAEFFIGMQMERDREFRTLKIHQSAYVNRILSKFNHEECSPLSIPADPNVKFMKSVLNNDSERKFPYREAIGSLMFLMVSTRPDLAYIVSVLSQFAEDADQSHWCGVKRVFRYLKGTINSGIIFGRSRDNCLIAYTDSDWAGDENTRRSTTGWICLLNGGPVTWLSQKQSSIALSATEAEFIALCSVTKEVIWLRRLLNDLHFEQKLPTTIHCDNQAAIKLVMNPVISKRSKHIETQYFYTCDKQMSGEIRVVYVSTNEQLADPLTKALSKQKFMSLLHAGGMKA